MAYDATLTHAAEGRARYGQRADFRSLRPIDYATLVICLILIPSAVIHGLFGVDEKIMFSLMVPVPFFAAVIVRPRLDQKYNIIVLMLMAGVLAASTIAGHQLCNTLNKDKALRYATWFAIILMAGAVIGIANLYFH